MHIIAIFFALHYRRRCRSRRLIRCVDYKSGQGAHAFDRELEYR